MVRFCGCVLTYCSVKGCSQSKKALPFQSRYVLEISAMDPGKRIQMENPQNSY